MYFFFFVRSALNVVILSSASKGAADTGHSFTDLSPAGRVLCATHLCGPRIRAIFYYERLKQHHTVNIVLIPFNMHSGNFTVTVVIQNLACYSRLYYYFLNFL